METKKRTLPGLNTGESKLYSMKAFFLELIFIFLFLLLFLLLFLHGKLGMMGNLAG